MPNPKIESILEKKVNDPTPPLLTDNERKLFKLFESGKVNLSDLDNIKIGSEELFIKNEKNIYLWKHIQQCENFQKIYDYLFLKLENEYLDSVKNINGIPEHILFHKVDKYSHSLLDMAIVLHQEEKVFKRLINTYFFQVSFLSQKSLLSPFLFAIEVENYNALLAFT